MTKSPRSPHVWTTLGLVLAGIVLLVGCPLQFVEEERPNQDPNTFFDIAPGDTTFANEVFFRWLGTDLDSDVVAFQFQLVETDSLYFFARLDDSLSVQVPAADSGYVIRSIAPRRERNPSDPEDDPETNPNFFHWSDRVVDNFEGFADLEDGWYEFRARSIDARGSLDTTPARAQFYVLFDDVSPVPILLPGSDINCGRLTNVQRRFFHFTATDSSRNAETARERLEYQAQLRARGSPCTQHIDDQFDALPQHDPDGDRWGEFPPGDDPVIIGDSPPFLYVDLFPPGCTWIFTLRVRDPAGNTATFSCDLQAN